MQGGRHREWQQLQRDGPSGGRQSKQLLSVRSVVLHGGAIHYQHLGAGLLVSAGGLHVGAGLHSVVEAQSVLDNIRSKACEATSEEGAAELLPLLLRLLLLCLTMKAVSSSIGTTYGTQLDLMENSLPAKKSNNQPPAARATNQHNGAEQSRQDSGSAGMP